MPPTILFNIGSGSDTAASGAGPTPAETGSEGAVPVSTTKIGFFEGTPPDLSGVATDGTDALWMDTPSGRQFDEIIAKKDTQQSTTGDISSAGTTLSSTDTSGMAAGQLIKIEGAGVASADLITTIDSITDGSNLEVDDAASTTVVGEVVVNPKQVEVPSGYTANQLGLTWAIGGKRATFDNADSRTLFGATGAKGGWIIETETDQDVTTSPIVLAAGGSISQGNLVIRGDSASTRRVIDQSANANIFSANNTNAIYVSVGNLKFTNTSGSPKTSSNGIEFSLGANAGRKWVVQNCIFGDVTDTLYRGVYRLNAATPAIRFIDCEFVSCELRGLDLTGSSEAVELLNCWVHDCVSDGVRFNFGTTLVIDHGCIIEGNGGNGVVITGTISTLGLGIRITGSTIHGNTSDGIDLSAATNPSPNLVITNNNITANGGYGINDKATTEALKGMLDFNNFGTGATANTSGAINNATPGDNDLNVDPSYGDAGDGNFEVGTNVKALGFPKATRTIGANQSNTNSFVDIGAAQREEAAGGGGLLTHPGMAGGMRG